MSTFENEPFVAPQQTVVVPATPTSSAYVAPAPAVAPVRYASAPPALTAPQVVTNVAKVAPPVINPPATVAATASAAAVSALSQRVAVVENAVAPTVAKPVAKISTVQDLENYVKALEAKIVAFAKSLGKKL